MWERFRCAIGRAFRAMGARSDVRCDAGGDVAIEVRYYAGAWPAYSVSSEGPADVLASFVVIRFDAKGTLYWCLRHCSEWRPQEPSTMAMCSCLMAVQEYRASAKLD